MATQTNLAKKVGVVVGRANRIEREHRSRVVCARLEPTQVAHRQPSVGAEYPLAKADWSGVIVGRCIVSTHHDPEVLLVAETLVIHG